MNTLKYNKYQNKAVNYYNKGRYDKAIKYCDKLVKYDSWPDIWIVKGNSHSELREFEAALKCYDMYLYKDPTNHAVWLNKGLVYFETNRYKAAIKCFEKVSELNPTFSEVLPAKARSYFELGNFEEALNCCNEFLEFNPTDEDMPYLKSIILERMNSKNRLLINTVKCSECGFKNIDDSNFCECCGKSLQNINNLNCSSCGFLNPKIAIFCQECGKRLKRDI